MRIHSTFQSSPVSPGNGGVCRRSTSGRVGASRAPSYIFPLRMSMKFPKINSSCTPLSCGTDKRDSAIPVRRSLKLLAGARRSEISRRKAGRHTARGLKSSYSRTDIQVAELIKRYIVRPRPEAGNGHLSLRKYNFAEENIPYIDPRTFR